ncbi:WXG100 family type VII secretion target [Amycolatopsis panacis]|uniref:WXG100 family type VII secretion target n=1 Tax=Amycolatopsis panacis TaxID=2340917 RepID=A0A419HPM7_9PSEU|nr:hypothetical protein [Amycolatopsis panacis]RJQ78314.1 hypothetical protein D5S19_27980 [Amycolatopsis panacis]
MSVVEPTTTGAGVADSWYSVASSIREIRDLHGADAAAVGVEIGVSLAGAIADTVAFALDPLGKLIAAGLGWMVEHLSFLKTPLDKLAGDPAAIKAMAEQLHRTGEDLRNSAKDLDLTLEKTITEWQGGGFEAFRNEIGQRRGQIESAGQSVDAAGYVVETTMALVTASRALIRDMITTFLGEIISTMLIALGMAAFTFGASLIAGVANCVRVGISLALDFSSKLAKIVGLGGRTAARLAELAAKVKPAPGGGRAGGAHELTDLRPPTPHDPGTPPPPRDVATPLHEEDPYATWLAADRHFNPPPHNENALPSHDPGAPSPHSARPSSDTTTTSSTPSAGTEPPAPKPQSPFKPYDIEFMKKHEDWMKSACERIKDYTGGKNAWDDIVKAPDKFFRKYPDAYPYLKGIADTKSSKNLVGWGGKSAVTLDKSLTDVQMQADDAWAQSDEQWRTDPAGAPDPAAQKA